MEQCWTTRNVRRSSLLKLISISNFESSGWRDDLTFDKVSSWNPEAFPRNVPPFNVLPSARITCPLLAGYEERRATDLKDLLEALARFQLKRRGPYDPQIRQYLSYLEVKPLADDHGFETGLQARDLDDLRSLI